MLAPPMVASTNPIACSVKASMRGVVLAGQLIVVRGSLSVW